MRGVVLEAEDGTRKEEAGNLPSGPGSSGAKDETEAEPLAQVDTVK